MKKFISLFLVISIMMWNINSGVVEALSSFGNEVKSLANTLTNKMEEKIVDVKDGKELEKQTTKVYTNNDVDSTKVIGSTNKNNKESKSSDKKVLIPDDEGNMKEHAILFYDLESNEFYYINQDNQIQKLPSTRDKIIKNKINLNNLLRNSNLGKSNNILDVDEVTLVITGSGEERSIYFDNEDEEYFNIPFNIIFYEIKGRNCSFSFQSVKSISVKGENTIENSQDYTALTYSFNDEYLNPLKIDDGSSFIVYNKEKDIIDNNIVYSDYDYDDSDDNLDTSDEISKNSGYSSVVNISFEDNTSQDKKFILYPNSNNTVGGNNTATQKEFSGKKGYKSLSILLLSDDNSYILKEKGNDQIPYYYRTSNSIDDSNEEYEIEGSVKIKINLEKNSTNNCYEVNNKQMIEVISTKSTNTSNYLVDTLEKAMSYCLNRSGYNYQIVFLGNYTITEQDVNSIRDYNKSINGITFKTNVDDYKYLLNIDEDIELMVDNTNKFDVTFEDIKFNYKSSGKFIYANGRPLKFGNNIEMEGKNYPSISLGGRTLLESSNTKNDASLVINSGIYGFVIGDYYNKLRSVNVNITGGTFNNEVIVVMGQVEKDAILNISNDPTFKSYVLGASIGSSIEGSLNVSIKGGTFINKFVGVDGSTVNSVKLTINSGTFRNQVIGINRSTVDNAKLIINNGNFNSDIIGDLSNLTTEKYTFKSILNRYLLSNSIKRSNRILQRNSSSTITIDIKAGAFKGNLIGKPQGDAIININGSNITIKTISDFTDLVVGGSKKTTLNINKLDKRYSTGDLYLKNGSKILFKKARETSKLNDINLEGSNNTLALDKNIISYITKENFLIDLSGEIKASKSKKLKIELNKSNSNITNGIYLIKFNNELNSDIEGKYNISPGYYIADKNENSSKYLILYPQIYFTLEYNLEDNQLRMINSENINNGGDVWWYNKSLSSNDVNLNSRELYSYKGYDLLPNGKDRNLILIGESPNRNITVDNDLTNFNVVLNGIKLTNSNITLNNLTNLIVNGENTIDNVNSSNTVDTFKYNFKNDNQTSGKVSFKTSDSHLKIFTKENTNPFNENKENCIDFKFLKPFEDERTVRLNNNTGNISKFTIPKNTQRLGVLVDNSGKDVIYKLYDGDSGETGSSVYVSGKEEGTFTDKFKTHNSYEYVRCANPVSIINVDIPRDVYFGVNVEAKELNSINNTNWQNYFSATDIKIKNSSLVCQDKFTDENEKVHYLGKGDTNADIELGYMGVYVSQPMCNEIQLISNEKLDSTIEQDNMTGVKLALKLGNTPIDESQPISDTPLQKWYIPYEEETVIKIEPNFGNKSNFFNINKYASDTLKLNSYHKFVFKYGIKQQ